MSTKIPTEDRIPGEVDIQNVADADNVWITLTVPAQADFDHPRSISTSVKRAELLGAIYDELDVLLATHEDEARNLDPEQDRRVSALFQARAVLGERSVSPATTEKLLTVARWIIDGDLPEPKWERIRRPQPDATASTTKEV